jgi:hypothetical protein
MAIGLKARSLRMMRMKNILVRKKQRKPLKK